MNKIKEEELDMSAKEIFLEKNFVTQDESKRIHPSNEMEVESSSSSLNDSAPLSNMQKKTKIIPKTNEITQDESQITHT